MEPRREGGHERPREQDDGLSDLARAYRKVGPFLHMGWTLALSLALGTLGGWWLDGKLDTSPLFVILGALLGMALGFYEFFRTVSRLQ